MSKHTPGPWQVIDLSLDQEEGQLKVHDGEVCLAVLGRGPFVDNEARANALLMAAGPDMLAALEQAQAIFCDPDTKYAHSAEMIRAAIRKAKEGPVRIQTA